MIRTFCLSFLAAFLFSPQAVFASSAQAEVTTNVQSNGKVEIYQSVEATVNGETIKKESNSPGKLELKVEQSGNSTNVSYQKSTPESTPTPDPKISQTPDLSSNFQKENSGKPFLSWISEFARSLLSNLTFWLK